MRSIEYIVEKLDVGKELISDKQKNKLIKLLSRYNNNRDLHFVVSNETIELLSYENMTEYFNNEINRNIFGELFNQTPDINSFMIFCDARALLLIYSADMVVEILRTHYPYYG